jgi:hypothetical protein
MASSKLLKEAIADAKAVRETAIANAKIALEEAFTPRLQSILSKKLTAEMEGEEEEVEVNEDNDISTGIGTGDNKQPADKANSAQTDLSGISKETSPEGEELEDYDKVKDLTESEDEFGAEEEIPAEEPAMEAEMDAMAPAADDEEIDLDEILREMGYGDDEEKIEEEAEEDAEEMKAEVASLQAELKEAITVIKSLKGTINEVNLLNAKLLYANKLFRGYNLTNEQKVKVVENLDRTTSVREVKLVYATLSESMKFTGTERKVAAKKTVTEGFASKVQASTAPKKEIISESNELANRFKQLAGIINK